MYMQAVVKRRNVDKSLEYSSLREEHHTNRKFVFERPLIIVGVALAAAYKIPDGTNLQFVPLPFLALLLFNLWFTFNRMMSSARIVSYIQIMHEEKEHKDKFIGWENSLRKFRKWCHSGDGSHRKVKKNIKCNTPYRSMGFYNPVFIFHIIFGFMGVLIVTLYPKGFNEGILSYEGQEQYWGLANVLLFLVFFVFCTNYWPTKLSKEIEVSRRVWMKVFEIDDQENEETT